ncbi:TrmH family RNA methyltransferase [Myroides sp. LJL115]
MVTKNQIKLIKSLHQKKYRKIHGLFIAEGIKVIQELLNSSIALEHLYVSEPIDFNVASDQCTLVKQSDMQKMSALSAPSNALGVFYIPQSKQVDYKDLVVALDDVRDPGNLGTIIRLCDWFGISHIICSSSTVDMFNPKVVQSTMGSLSRVNLVYGDLKQMIQQSPNPSIVYGTFMDGANIYKTPLKKDGILIFGNEANGISPELEAVVSQKLSIPRFGDLQQTESLNVAMATSIVLSEFRRNL